MTPTLLDIITLTNDFPAAIYQYGSRVYGTINEKSDWDYIVISDRHKDKLDIHNGNELNITVYPVNEFKKQLEMHEISAIELFFLNKEHVVYSRYNFDFKLDLVKLRHSVCQKVSHSWVKAKKKLTVMDDFDPYIGKKSLFHSLRILDFGVQIAKHGRINNYSSANKYYEQIMFGPDDWPLLDSQWRPVKNSGLTEFRLLAGKE